MKPASLALCSLLVASGLHAGTELVPRELSFRSAGRLTLEEVTRAAIENNAAIKAARANWERMKARIPQARAWEDPMVGVDVERSGTTRFETYTDAEWMLSQKIPIAGKNLARGRVADAEARATLQELRRQEFDVVAKVPSERKAAVATALRRRAGTIIPATRIRLDTARRLQRRIFCNAPIRSHHALRLTRHSAALAFAHSHR